MFSRAAKHATLVTALVALFAGTAGSVFAADAQFDATHPRRAEVNQPPCEPGSPHPS